MGLTGAKVLVAPGHRDRAFPHLGRHFYAPLCAGIALATLPAARC